MSKKRKELASMNTEERTKKIKELKIELVKSMTGALRLTRFDGFSEILAKSYLWGQQPLSPYIPYPYKNREDLLKVLNKYVWNQNNEINGTEK